MNYNEIKKLIEDMGNSKLTSLDIEFPDGIKIKMEKNPEKNIDVVTKISEVEQTSNNVATINNNDLKEENQEEEGQIVKSPMVGTFYMKPSPESEPFVEIGTEVKKGTVLCIIEAMKLMNEIESEYEGQIVDILVKDGEPVEYGKPLFVIK